MKNNKLKIEKVNLGIELLRFLLCFWIVIAHCSIIKKEHYKYCYKGFHIPTFVVVSFYFFYPKLSKRDITKIKARFKRLLIPYILWPVFILLLNNILLKLFSLGQFMKFLTIKDLLLQILFGLVYHRIFWFQFNLIFLSLFFSIIAFLLKKKLLSILLFLFIISIYLHYSGIIFKILIYNKFRDSIGPLIELIPIAVLGCVYSSTNIFIKIKNFSFNFHYVSLLFIIFFFQYSIIISPNGFRYPNVLLNILTSTLFLSSFGSFSFHNRLICLIITNITKFTGGIYYIHMILRDYLQKYYDFFMKKTYFSSSLIYILSFLICLMGNRIFKNRNLKYLFI